MGAGCTLKGVYIIFLLVRKKKSAVMFVEKQVGIII